MAGKLFVIAAIAITVLAQEPTFEVASVKKAAPITGVPAGPPMRGGPGTPDPEHLTIVMNLRSLVWSAFGVQYFQVAGPTSMDTDTCQIEAKLPPGTDKERATRMLRNLLIERLSLQFHHETRPLPVFRLPVDARGSKLQPSSGGDGTASGRIIPTKKASCPCRRA